MCSELRDAKKIREIQCIKRNIIGVSSSTGQWLPAEISLASSQDQDQGTGCYKLGHRWGPRLSGEYDNVGTHCHDILNTSRTSV